MRIPKINSSFNWNAINWTHLNCLMILILYAWVRRVINCCTTSLIFIFSIFNKHFFSLFNFFSFCFCFHFMSIRNVWHIWLKSIALSIRLVFYSFIIGIALMSIGLYNLPIYFHMLCDAMRCDGAGANADAAENNNCESRC